VSKWSTNDKTVDERWETLKGVNKASTERQIDHQIRKATKKSWVTTEMLTKMNEIWICKTCSN